MEMDAKQKAHLEFLREKIFQIDTKWPHFSRLLEELTALAASTPDGAHVVILERAYVYGGFSLFAPLFSRQKVTVVDCHIASTAERQGYQANWLDDPRCVRIPATSQAPITQTGLPDHCADLLINPNVIHHVRDQAAMFNEMARLLKPKGTGLLFEALIRELHQIPDDYLRYTPWGFEKTLADHGMKLREWKPVGGPFEAIAYCWVQALQYFPADERAEKEKWFFKTHFSQLMEWDKKYTENQVRKHTTFPVAYSVTFELL